MSALAEPIAFAPVSYEDWRARVDEELGETPFETLVSRLREGIAVEPLFCPTHPPPVRTGRGWVRPGTRWRAGQEVAVPATGDAAAALRTARAAGAEHLWLRAAGDAATGEDDLARLFAAADPFACAVTLDAGAVFLPVVERWLGVAGDRAAELRGGLGADPLGALARGRLDGSLDRAFAELAGLVRRVADRAPGLRAALVSTAPYRDAGADAVQELAFLLATGAEVLRRLDAAGIAPERAARQIELLTVGGSELFLEIAKLRAARIVWAKLVAACGGDASARRAPLVARTAALTWTRYSPRLNLLRAGVQAFAAVAGGADTVLVAPHDAALGTPSETGRRWALTLQHVLAEEAGLGRVADPAAGSWYVEWLTDRLARDAWALFQALERRGGMARCLRSGEIARRVGEAAERLRRRVATREHPIVGVSAFPHLDEEPVTPPAPPAGDEPAPEGLRPFRLAEPFEALRDAARARDRRPRAFLARLGRACAGRAEDRTSADRASFARRLLAAGGIEGVIDGPFADPAAAVAAFDASGARICVLCPDRDPEPAHALAPRLQDAGARRVLVVGDADLEAHAGIDGVLCEGRDVLGLLRALHDALEIER